MPAVLVTGSRRVGGRRPPSSPWLGAGSPEAIACDRSAAEGLAKRTAGHRRAAPARDVVDFGRCPAGTVPDRPGRPAQPVVCLLRRLISLLVGLRFRAPVLRDRHGGAVESSGPT
ncbi:hypothetical protein HBB16_13315 [Pseudonocardia sp. MCCB 268]|nr:hypothetical protein [Pseudonocardia cytotoxica]